MRALKLSVLLLCFSVLVILNGRGASAQFSSSQYSANEIQFGTGSDFGLSSTSYSGQASTGSLGAGDFYSANYGVNAGFLTQNEVFLEMSVSASSVSLGTLSPTSTARGTGTFTVRTYLSQSYSVFTVSPPLTNETGHQFSVPSSPTLSTTGIEQFGINLVLNANFCGSGCNLGADPVNQPDNSFAAGSAATGYDTANYFKYHQGDIVADAPSIAGNKSIGQTAYTISYIANQAPLTNSGLYTMDQDLVVVPSY